MRRAAGRTAAALLLALAAAAPGQAQSVFGCAGLDARGSQAAVEGSDGVFYAIDPDLMMFHPAAEESMADLARLSAALATLGTTLIYAPLPAKGLTLPDQLPSLARDLGFDADLAASVHQEMLERLAAAGVRAVDLRAPLRAPVAEGLSVFGTDPRLTTAGARRAARAIAAAVAATPGFADLPKARFESRSAGLVTLPSAAHGSLQQRCMITLPPVATEAFVTTRAEAAVVAGVQDTALFATPAAGGAGAVAGATRHVALVGSAQAGAPAANLHGFLAEFTGLDVQHYSVADDDAFAAISTYLTSAAFQETRPAFLVWVNPVPLSLAARGDQPMAELIAAAGAECRVPLPLFPAQAPDMLVADLTALDPGQTYTLFVDSDGAPARVARFDFTDATGLVQSRSIHRHAAQVPTGRFYLPLAGLAPGLRSVAVALDAPFGPNARVTACFD